MAQRDHESLVEYVKRFNKKKLFMENLKQDVASVSFTNKVRLNGLSEKFIVEPPAILKRSHEDGQTYI